VAFSQEKKGFLELPIAADEGFSVQVSGVRKKHRS
jgi:hypothetical protein